MTLEITPDQRRRREAEALEGCETEPIQTIGTIQPFGALVATDRDLTRISHASANVAEHLGLSLDDVLDASLEAVLGSELAHGIRNVAGLRTIEAEREYLGTYRIGPTDLDVHAHSVAGSMIIEMQPVDDGPDAARAFGLVRRVLAQINLDNPVDQLASDAVHPLRGLSGFDRVMAYQFSPTGSGEVVAESRRASVESFLGLHFPAFDIPESARRLYVSTPIRTIGDVSAEQSPILASPSAAGEPELDLSLAVLRGTVAVHTQYLENMGVRASLTLPIVVEGELWGLFAFHHHEPRVLPPALIMACELAGRTLSMRFESRVRQQRWNATDTSLELAASLLAKDDGSAGYGLDWDAVRGELASFVPCDGVAFIVSDQIYTDGSCPSIDAVRDIARELDDPSGVCLVDDLHERFGALDLGRTAGAACLSVRALDTHRVVFFRDEAMHSIRWAGAPDKLIDETDEGLRLRPRASFAEFSDAIEGRSFPWRRDDVLALEGLRSTLVASLRVSDATATHKQQLGLVMQELNHRIRNVLALVQSLAHQTRGSSDDVDSYALGLDERIASLAAAHDLLTERDWSSVELATLIERTSAPFSPELGKNVQMRGAPISLDASIASLFSLLIHELCSNAVRHGALSVPTGLVTISWEFSNDELVFQWTESGGPTVSPPTRRGFGSALINDAVPFELEGSSSVDYRPEGLAVEVRLPDRFVDMGEPAELLHEVSALPVASEEAPTYVLVVEDDFLVSIETVRVLEEQGWPEVEAVASRRQALRVIEQRRPDFAVLDVNLRGEFSGPVASRLVELQIPFIFVTGYGSDFDLSEFADVIMLPKPLDRRRLLTVVGGIFPALEQGIDGGDKRK